MARTDQQRKAIEVYCRLLAEAFNDAGLDRKTVLTQFEFNVSWTQENVKELFKDVLKSMFNKKSTADLDPKQVSLVEREINKWTSEKFGISVEFPDNNRIPVSAYERD